MAKGRSSALRFLVITFRIFLIVVGYSMIPAGMERIADAEPPYQAMQQFWGQLSIMIGAVVGVLSLGIVIGLFFRQRWAAWIAFISDLAIAALLMLNVNSRNFTMVCLFSVPLLLDSLYMAKLELKLGK